MKAFIEQYELIKEAKLGFVQYLQSNPDEYEDLICRLDDIIVELHKTQLVVSYQFDESIEYVQILLSIIIDKEKVANYSYLINLDGEVMDDCLIFGDCI